MHLSVEPNTTPAGAGDYVPDAESDALAVADCVLRNETDPAQRAAAYETLLRAADGTKPDLAAQAAAYLRARGVCVAQHHG